MKVIGYKSIEKKQHQKITSYSVLLNGKNIMLDYGTILGSEAKNIDAIFLTHEHFDHFYGLTYDLEYINCPIYATKTTKRLINKLSDSAWNAMLVSSKNKLLNIIEVEYYKRFNYEDINFYFYPSGHTFGSSMIHLIGEYSILYTGDLDYNKNNPKRQYLINDYSNFNTLDYIIVDGTTFTKPPYKMQTVNRLLETSIDINKRTYNVRPEKAVFIAEMMAECKGSKDSIIIYERDLKWFLDILMEEGYYPYIDDKVVLEAPSILNKNYNKEIRLSSINYDNRQINSVVGLHISLVELEEFILTFSSNPKVLVGHYLLDDSDEVLIKCEERGYIMLKEGVNEIEK